MNIFKLQTNEPLEILQSMETITLMLKAISLFVCRAVQEVMFLNIQVQRIMYRVIEGL